MAKKVKVGDLIQVLTSQGVAYAHYTHKHDEYGYFIRVFTGFYAEVPMDYDKVCNSNVLFSAFFPLQSAVNQGLVSVVGNMDVAPSLSTFPVFRARNGGAGGSIWLWDGANSVRLDRPLTHVEQCFPVKSIISAPLLVDRIQRGYRAEVDDRWT